MIDTDEYEVFKGAPEVKSSRLGIVRGSQRARELMYSMYARLPGDYFIRHSQTGEVISSLQKGPRSRPGVCAPRFDIFRGLPDKDAVWIETVEGLASARERMEEIAMLAPGTYFVFSRLDHSVLAYIDGLDAGTDRGTAA